MGFLEEAQLGLALEGRGMNGCGRRERDMAELCKFPPESIAMLKCIKPGKKGGSGNEQSLFVTT